MAELMEHVEALADQIGPRPVSTEEERQASLYIAQELTDLGLEVNVDEFATPTGTKWPYVIAFAAVIVGTILSGLGMFVEVVSTPMFIVGLILVAAGFAIYYTERTNMSFLSRMRAGGVSQNVVAKYVPSSVARERSRRKIIIAAHVDTVRAEPQASPALVNRYPLIRKILFYVMIALAALFVIRLLPLPWPDIIDMVLWVISIIGCVFLLACLGCIVANRFMPYVSGGNDNASSAAVMLNVARRLLDPAERERWAREQREIEVDVPVETLAPQSTGSFPAVATDNVIQLHGSDAAEEAGIEIEGAEIEYLDEGDFALEETEAWDFGGETVAMPAVGESVQDDADAPAQDEGAFEPAGEEFDNNAPLADVIEFAPAEQDMPQDEEDVVDEFEEVAEEEPEPLIPQDTENVPLGGAWPQPQEYEPEEEEPAEEEDFVPEFLRDPDETISQNVPSWYTAARAKAAKDKAAKEQAKAEQEASAEQPVFRSRFADMPLPPETRQEVVEPEPEAEEPVEEPRKPRRRLVDLHTGEDITDKVDESAAPATQEEPAAEAEEVSDVEAAAPQADTAEQQEAVEQAAAPESEQEQIALAEEDLFTFDFDEEEIGDISPDLTGSFARIDAERAARPQNLVSVIPAIGSSDVVEAVAETDESKPEPEDAAEQPEDAVEQVEAAAEQPEVVAEQSEQPEQKEVVEAAEKAKPVEEQPHAQPKVERRRPTARRVTEEFQPTRVADDREEIELGSTRQMAAVSSSYESTPQAAPRARRSEEPRPSRTGSQRPVSRASQLGPTNVSPAARTSAIDMSSRPGSTSSFPALTGSFPALTGSIPTVSEDDFGTSTGGDFLAPSNDPFAPSSASMTGTIDIPDSAFHNAVENVGGLFSKLGRKGKNTQRDEYGADGSQGWGEDDDFGWKGGGYYNDDSGLGDAARRRAAEIRESVISMTESDLLDKEVWFVALGASNANGQGMKNFLDLHQSELRGSLIINLECVGSGDIRYVDFEGTGNPRRADRRLMNLLKKASRAISGKEMKSQSMTWRNTDATYAMLSGMRAISVMGFDGVAPEGWHWSTDTADIVNPDKLEYVSKLLLKVIENS